MAAMMAAPIAASSLGHPSESDLRGLTTLAHLAAHLRLDDNTAEALFHSLGADPATPPGDLAQLLEEDWTEVLAGLRPITTPINRSRLGWVWCYCRWIAGLDEPPAPTTPPLAVAPRHAEIPEPVITVNEAAPPPGPADDRHGPTLPMQDQLTAQAPSA